MHAKPKRPWRMFAPLASVVALFAGWSGYWLVADATAQKYAAAYRGELASKGVSLACSNESWGGYPFRFEFTCTEPVVKLPGGGIIRSGALLAVAQAYNPRHAVALIDGPTTLTLPDNSTQTVTHGRAAISAVFRGEGLPQISADIPNIEIGGLFAAKDLQVHTRPANGHANDIAITVAAAAYTSPGKPPLRADSAQLLVTLTAAEDLNVTDLQIKQDTLKVWGKGTVKLDESNRIAGRITTQTNDLSRLLALLDPHIDLSDQERATLKTLLGLLGKEAKAEFVAQNGELFIGPVKIAKLAPLY